MYLGAGVPQQAVVVHVSTDGQCVVRWVGRIDRSLHRCAAKGEELASLCMLQYSRMPDLVSYVERLAKASVLYGIQYLVELPAITSELSRHSVTQLARRLRSELVSRSGDLDVERQSDIIKIIHNELVSTFEATHIDPATYRPQ